MTAGMPWRLAVCAGAFSACTALSALDVRLAAVVAAITCLSVALMFADLRVTTACAALVACGLGAWRGVSGLAVDHGPGTVSGHLGTGAVVLRGTVGDAGVPGRADTLVVNVHQLASHSGTWNVTGAVVVEPLRTVVVLPGDSVDVATSSLRAPPLRPGALSPASLERVGVTAIAVAAQVTRLAEGGVTLPRLAEQARRVLTTAVSRALPEPEATLLLGIAFGIHSTLAGAVRAPLQDAGLIHVVAVSGLKVVMVAGLVLAVGRPRGWSRRRLALATVGVVGAYVVLSGASAAALRSGVMVVAGLVLRRDGRRPHSFALLAACSAVLLAVEPAVATDIGFQLSFLGTAGIILLAGPIAARLPGPRLLAEPFAVTAAAQLATAPVTAAAFGVLSLVGPVANAAVLPLLPLVITVGGAGALLSAAAPSLGWVPLEVGALLGRAILALAQGFAALPFAALHLSLWPGQWTLVELAAAGAAGLAWRLAAGRGTIPSLTMLIAAACAVVGGAAATAVTTASAMPSWEITVLDVGNGAAVLVNPPRAGPLLVDGGADGTALVTALGRVLSPLQRHLDAVVLTSTDRAAASALPALLGRYDVGTLVVSQPLPAALAATAAAMAGTGTQVVVAGAHAWSLGGVTARCLPSAPGPSAPCVLQVSDGHSSALVTANLPQAGQDELAGVQGRRLRSDLLVGPTTTAPAAALLDVTRPALVAVPAKRIPPGLAAIDLPVAVTGRDGDIVYQAQPGGGFADQGT